MSTDAARPYWKEQVNVEIGKLDDDTANLKAHLQTLQGRLEALERAQAVDRERHIKVRRAIGQLAAAVGLMPK
jgi:predicted  nucleic acid-binding Zn-ribbon protein